MAFTALGDVSDELFYSGLGGGPFPGDISDFDLDGDGISDAGDKIALIQRGAFPFWWKALNAMLAGTTGVVIFNQNPGNFLGTLVLPDICAGLGGSGSGLPIPNNCPWNIPIVSISNADGVALLNEVGVDNSGSVTVRLLIEPSNYAFNSGTSMATPHVAGVAALVMSANSDLNNREVRQILSYTAENLGIPGQRDIYYGWGLVNALAAVNAATP